VIAALLLAGFGIGWVASYFFVVRSLVRDMRDMRYQGFVHDRPPSKLKLEPRAMTRNES